MPAFHDDPSSENSLNLPLLSVRTAREAAFVAVEEYLESGHWVAEVIDRIFRTASLPPIERSLATELSCGVVRRLATLDSILSRLVARPLEKVEPPLLTILRLGIYQLALLDGVPPHAAVHETVELTKRLGRHQWSGFVNGVLRGGTRFITELIDTKPSSRGVPLGVDRYRRLVEPAFADPRSNPTAYFADAFSFPSWLAERWASRMSPSELYQLGAWFNSAGKLHLRVNRLRTTTEQLLDALSQSGVSASEVAGTGSVVLEESCAVEKLPGFDEGWFAVQDLSASRAAERLAPKSGQRVWDVCAAPGGKACHLAELMNNEGLVIATDIRPDRLAVITENRQRMGATIVEPRLIGEDGSRLPDGPFDAILVDVPCSNTGVLGKRPEARWRITPTGILELKRVQERLLMAAMDRLAPNGRLVYSTCSIEPEENGELVRRVLASRTDLKLVEDQLFLPGQPSDGGYQALMVRSD